MADATVIRERYAEGSTQADLAGEYGVVRRTVSKIVRNKIWHDPNYSPRPSYRLTMADASAIRERYAEGGTQAELAAQHGVHQVTVSKIVRNRRWHDPNYSPPIANGRGRRRQDNQNIQPATAETTEGDDDGSTSNI
jgi:transcriptional regulator with XRE-family HTH domain